MVEGEEAYVGCVESRLKGGRHPGGLLCRGLSVRARIWEDAPSKDDSEVMRDSNTGEALRRTCDYTQKWWEVSEEREGRVRRRLPEGAIWWI